MADEERSPDANAPPRTWQVLLVGGGSGVGKTAVARAVARRAGIPLSQVDGYRLMLERSTTAEQFPAIHRSRDSGARDESAGTRCANWVEVAKEMSGALEVVIAFHAATKAPVVLEGDTILPRLATARVLASVPILRRVRSVFLHEPDATVLAARLAARGRGYQLLSAAQQAQELERCMAYGDWLAREAAREGCPVLIPTVGEDGIEATATRVIALLTP